MERNVLSLDTVGLGLVERGVAKLDAKDREAAEGAFRTAVALAPGLPDGHAGLAVALLKKGPLGVVPSIDAAVSGLSAFLPTGRGHRSARDLATVAALLAAFAVAWAIALALLARRGGLLRHDLEEWLGPAQGRSASLGLFLLLLLLPVATFQGWGWLPLWWLALVFAYLDARERALAGLLLAAAVAVGPAVASLELRLRTARNPLFHAALAAVESAPDRGGDRAARGGGAQRPGGPRPRLPAGRRPPARGPVRGGGGAVPAAARGRSHGRGRAEQPREHRVRARQLRRGAGAVPGRHGGRGRGRDRGHLVLQPVARPSPEVRVPGLQRGQVERGPARPRAGGRLRPVEVRLARLRGGGPRPDPRAGPGQVRRERVGGRGAEHRRGAAAAGAGRGPSPAPWRTASSRRWGCSRSPPSSSGAGAGRRRSRSTAAGAGRPSAATATWGR